MKVLLIGSGGREHAMAWKIKQSSKVSELMVAPGNPGIEKIAKLVHIQADDIHELLNYAINHKIDLTIVGPEVPLVKGIVNLFEAEGLKIFGPNRYAAQFEGSKAFSKAFMDKHLIPTAAYEEFTDIDEAKSKVNLFGFPLVIKADGLAAGKGVVICENEIQARQTLEEMMADEKFGDAGSKVVFEAFLTGVEASVLCFVDGESIKPMTSAQDYKKAYDGDLGLNTGGMGAYSPSFIMNEALESYIEEHILKNFMKGLEEEKIDYKGILFIGLMIEAGQAKVIEFNCRMGDPETQVVLPRMENDLIDVIEACLEKRLCDIELKWKKEACVGVVLASGGYPEAYEKNKEIKGLETLEDQLVFHAGSKMEHNKCLTSGGRVLNVVALEDSIEAARKKVYQMIDQVSFEGMMYRKDIAKLI